MGLCAVHPKKDLNVAPNLEILLAGYVPPSYKDYIRVYPELQELTVPQNTPENIARNYKTALRNLDSGADADFEAAGILVRKALETAVNESNAQGANLKQKIDNLADNLIITRHMQQWAHEIRVIGNEAAHEDTPLTREDAVDAVNFTEMLLTYLFTLPGMIEERRNRRNAPVES